MFWEMGGALVGEQAKLCAIQMWHFNTFSNNATNGSRCICENSSEFELLRDSLCLLSLMVLPLQRNFPFVFSHQSFALEHTIMSWNDHVF